MHVTLDAETARFTAHRRCILICLIYLSYFFTFRLSAFNNLITFESHRNRHPKYSEASLKQSLRQIRCISRR